MKKSILYTLLFLTIMCLSSFGVHKFYVSIYQVNFNQKKQMLEITSRIFMDDLNDILKSKYNQKTHIGETSETPDDIVLMKKYILGNFFTYNRFALFGLPMLFVVITKPSSTEHSARYDTLLRSLFFIFPVALIISFCFRFWFAVDEREHIGCVIFAAKCAV